MGDVSEPRKTGREAQLTETTPREYEAMVHAVEAMERALASPAPGREVAWKQRTRHELANVVGFLQEHCESTEREGGLLVEVELKLGRPYDLNEARREHERLLRDAVTLLAALEAYQDELSHHEVRRRAWDLTAGLRSHQAREADLLIEALQRDTGIGH